MQFHLGALYYISVESTSTSVRLKKKTTGLKFAWQVQFLVALVSLKVKNHECNII